MNTLLLLSLIVFALPCFSMEERSSTITKWTDEKCQQLLENCAEANNFFDEKIKDPNFPLRELVDGYIPGYRKTIGPICFLSASHSNRFEEFKAIDLEVKKKFIALRLLHKQQLRKKEIHVYDRAIRTASFFAAFMVPPSVYFFKQTWGASIPLFLINAAIIRHYRAQRKHMKAIPKPTFSEAVKEEFSYSKDEMHKALERLKITVDPNITDIKKRYRKACKSRNVEEIVMLAALMDPCLENHWSMLKQQRAKS